MDLENSLKKQEVDIPTDFPRPVSPANLVGYYSLEEHGGHADFFRLWGDYLEERANKAFPYTNGRGKIKAVSAMDERMPDDEILRYVDVAYDVYSSTVNVLEHQIGINSISVKPESLFEKDLGFDERHQGILIGELKEEYIFPIALKELARMKVSDFVDYIAAHVQRD